MIAPVAERTEADRLLPNDSSSQGRWGVLTDLCQKGKELIQTKKATLTMAIGATLALVGVATLVADAYGAGTSCVHHQQNPTSYNQSTSIGYQNGFQNTFGYVNFTPGITCHLIEEDSTFPVINYLNYSVIYAGNLTNYICQLGNVVSEAVANASEYGYACNVMVSTCEGFTGPILECKDQIVKIGQSFLAAGLTTLGFGVGAKWVQKIYSTSS